MAAKITSLKPHNLLPHPVRTSERTGEPQRGGDRQEATRVVLVNLTHTLHVQTGKTNENENPFLISNNQ